MHVLIVDDEPSNRRTLEVLLSRSGYSVASSSNGREALESFSTQIPDIIVTDLKMPEMDGMELLQEVKTTHPEIEVIVCTAYGSIDTAVEAMKIGAWNFITKPIKRVELLKMLEKITVRQELATENQQLRSEIAKIQPDWIGQSPSMQRITEEALSVADSEASVFLTGKSGTGKSLLAKWIHKASPRNRGQFVVLNCGAIPENLMESELFGHEKGAFTGAHNRKIGRLEQANGGTLFLDEVTEMSPQLQVKLLRVLQDGEFERVGGNTTLMTNLRIIAASNRNIPEAIAQGQFREDLYYRLNVIPMHLPPLSERLEDIPLLVEHFLQRQSARNNRPFKPITHAALHALMQWDWPGNIRELENTIERAVVLSKGPEIDIGDLPQQVQHHQPSDNLLHFQIGTPLKDIERAVIVATLQEVDGDKHRAAELLGIAVRTLYRKEAEWREEP